MRVIASNLRRRLKLRSSLFEQLENRQLLSTTLNVGTGQTYTTIQAAVNAATAGDTIDVMPGTYNEQVTIPAPLTGLTIQAQNSQTSPSSITVPANSSVSAVNALFPDAANSSIITAPTSMTGNKAIIDDLAANVTITGFVIEGPSQGIGFGVLVEGGATSVQINNNHILHIHDAPISGNQTGFAVDVNGGSSASISENFISDYQKNGIFITGTGSIGTVSQNVVVGQGPTSIINQNGVVFDSAASGSVSSTIVTGNSYTPETTEDGGILLFNSGQVSITNNVSYNNDGDIILDGPSTSPAASPGNYSDYAHGTTISGNETYGATFDGIDLFDGANSVTISNNKSHNNGFDGVLIDSSSYGNLVENNTFTNNETSAATAFDIEDDTYQQTNPVVGNYGTANFYSGNTAGTTNFVIPVTGDTIFSPTSGPASNFQNVADPNITSAGGVDLGVKFTSDVAGTVTGVRFYKGSLNTGVHLGELWSSTGTLLASVTFTGESASGWQQASFSSPVTISANTLYIIAYHTTAGDIAYTPGGLSSGVDNPPLHALANGVNGGDGVYHYDSTPGSVVFPNQYNGQAPNYWVDVVFTPSTAQPSVTIFSPTSAPATPNVADPNITAAGGVDIGTKFTSDVSGLVDSVRFYKGSQDTGVHIGELWSTSGTLLASVTFTGESASGWQQANFSTPVSITANTVYIVAYHTTAGFIAYTSGGLSSAIDNAPLHALASGPSGGNGVYHYDLTPGTPAFPSLYNGQAPNYWVDVVFTPSSSTAPTDTIFSPTSAPSTPNVSDPNIATAGGVDIGTKFTSDVAGVVDGVRFYEGSSNTGVQIGELWSSTGTLLASATFTSETGSGWQQVNFSSPVSISANTVYIIAYHTTSSTIAYTPGGLTSGIDNSPLHALANGASGGDGVYNYDVTPGTPVYPSLYNGQAPNYWVDVVFTPS